MRAGLPFGFSPVSVCLRSFRPLLFLVKVFMNKDLGLDFLAKVFRVKDLDFLNG